MAFKVNSLANSNGAVATPPAATATVSPTAIATPATPPAAATKTELAPLLTALKATLNASGLTEAKDITLANLRAVDAQLATGIQTIATALGFETPDSAIALKYIPQTVSEEGAVKDALLLLFSIVSNSDASCDLRWVNERVSCAPDENVYIKGLRLGGEEPSVVTGGYVAPMSAMVKRDLPLADKKRIATCDSFAELSPYLAAGGSNIVSDPVDGYLLQVTGAETRKSSKGKEYTLIMGIELSLTDSTPQGEAALFSPVGADYWVEAQANALHGVVIQFLKEQKCFKVLSAADGAELDTIALGGKRAKLRELKIGTTWSMVGTKQTNSEEYGKGWVVRLVQTGEAATGDVIECYCNSKLSDFIDDNEEKILKAAGVPAQAGEFPILDFQVTDKPFGTLRILSHEKLNNGNTKVNLVTGLNLNAAQKTDQQALLEKLGLA